MAEDRVTRIDFDAESVGSIEETSQGYIRLKGAFSRTGILEYKNPDGSTRRELRLPDEVFSKKSLDSFLDAPITHLHPKELVTIHNDHELSKGYVKSAKREDHVVAGSILVKDPDQISLIKGGVAKEISCGYTCWLEFAEPGSTFEGQPYDVIQRDIEINHVGLGPSGWGRSGSDVSLRLDGSFSVSGETEVSNGPVKVPEENQLSEKAKKSVYKLDKHELELSDERDVTILSDFVEKRDSRIQELESEVEKLKTDVEAASEIRAKFDSLQKKYDEAAELQKETSSVEFINARVADRIKIIEESREITGEENKVNCDGLDEMAIRVATLDAVNEVSVANEDAAYVRAAFSCELKYAKERKEAQVRKDNHDARTAASGGVSPASPVHDVTKAMREAVESMNSANAGS